MAIESNVQTDNKVYNNNRGAIQNTHTTKGESADGLEPTDESMTWADIETVTNSEIDNAIKYTRNNVSPERIQKWDRYYGNALGNEVKGKSKYMSRDLLETIEWIMPTLMKTFAAGDPKIKLKINNDATMGKVLMDKIHNDLSADNMGTLYTNFYTWFKDALVSGTAFIKMFWEVDYVTEEHQFDNVSLDGMKQLQSDEGVSVTGAKFGENSFREVIADITKLRRNSLAAENIPHWEFVANRRTLSVNDEFGKGHVTIVTMDYLKRINKQFTEEGEEDFFLGLDELEALTGDPADMGGHDSNYLSDEKREYHKFESLTDHKEYDTEKGSKAMIQLTEWFTRLDINGDGFLVDCIVWRANGVMLRYEINDQGFIGMSSLSPMIDCYKFYGLAYSDLIIEIQNLKTMITRRILDNFDFQNSGRWAVKPGKTVDLKGLLDNVPGDVISINPEHIKDIAPKPFDPRVMTLLEYLDGVKENRTGSTRYNQGTDAGSLNQTAQGIGMIMSASIQRIELIARLLAEGLKDFYHKCAMLYQQNLTEPFEAKIKGQKIMIKPEDIQGEILAIVDMGVTAQAGQVEAQKIQQVAATLTEFNKIQPGLFGQEELYNCAVKFVETTGFQSEDYVASLEKFMQEQEQMKEAQKQQQEMVQQMAAKELEIKEREVKVKEDKNEIERLKIDSDKEEAIAIQASKERIEFKKMDSNYNTRRTA